mgnify:CR=1 FL=1
MLTTTKMKRVFEYKGKKLADPSPDMTPDEVMMFYANTYPELTTSTVESGVTNKGEMLFKFKTTIGTKG